MYLRVKVFKVNIKANINLFIKPLEEDLNSLNFLIMTEKIIKDQQIWLTAYVGILESKMRNMGQI